MTIWNSLVDGLAQLLRTFHNGIAPIVSEEFAWGWAIVLLTLAVRIVLLPLAVKQITSMRAMQQLQPEVKKIQKKYKADRSMMRSDPEKYRETRQKQQEALMKLYKEHNVNPAGGCLPLVLQMPVFFALFTVLRDNSRIPELAEVGWHFISSLGGTPTAAGNVGAFALVALMGASTWYSQKQMMAKNPASAEQPQMRMMLYIMPVMLTFFAFNFPVGVLIYWVTTNVWTIAQQWVMFRNVEHSVSARRPKEA